MSTDSGVAVTVMYCGSLLHSRAFLYVAICSALHDGLVTIALQWYQLTSLLASAFDVDAV
jgi:hypothetical protein